jgi:hypothetical protein
MRQVILLERANHREAFVDQVARRKAGPAEQKFHCRARTSIQPMRPVDRFRRNQVRAPDQTERQHRA